MRSIIGCIVALALLPSTLCAAIAPAEEQAGRGSAPAPRPGDAPVPYVVVTDRQLAGAFMPLVHARTAGGLNAAVVTLQTIEAGYPAGVDLAERIRMFLKDAYADWGTRWVLLGGDASVVPMRRAHLRNVFITPELDLPTDQYYACLDGSWNADGDAYWGELPGPGEPGDDVDLDPELFVGRAPVRTAEEVSAFVRRTRAYEARLATAAPRAALLAADVINGIVDGAQTTEALRPALEADPTRRIVRLYENAAAWPGALQESRTSLLAALDGGFDLAALVGAGGRGIIVAGQDPADRVTADDLLGLTNAPLYPVVYALSAYTTDPDAPLSIGTALMQAHHGGAAAVVGCTNLQLVGIASTFMLRFFDEALGTDLPPIGEAQARTITALNSTFVLSDFARLTTQGNVLLGDPALRLDPLDAAVAVGRPPRTPQSAHVEGGPGLDAAAAEGVTLAIAGDAASTRIAHPVPPVAEPGTDASRVALEAPVPSPARSMTSMRFELPRAAAGARYELAVFDLLGRRVRTLAGGTAAPGRFEAGWDLRTDRGAVAPAGVYIARLSVAGASLSRRLLVLR